MSRTSPASQQPLIAVIGNVVEDRAGDGWVPGGPSLYCARTAAALGARVILTTNLPRGYDRDVLAGLTIRESTTAAVPRYVNTYSPEGDRTQVLFAPGDPLAWPDLAELSPDAVIVAPAFHELDEAFAPRALVPCPAPLVAFALQGFLRDAAPDGRVIHRPLPSRFPGTNLARGSNVFAFLSDEDAPDSEQLARTLAVRGLQVVLTRGYRAVKVFQASAVTPFPVLPATPVDPTGAGDCFAAACVVRLAEGAPIEVAVPFATAAAALMIEGVGLAGIPSRAAVEARLAQAAA